jgi:hypothetical protein
MNFNRNLSDENSGLPIGLTEADITALTHYPTLAKLFDGANLEGIATMKTKLNLTIQNLERVVIRGSRTDSEQAQIAVTAIRNALDFLELLEQMRRQ